MPIIIESKISHQFTQSPKENKNERRIKLENHRFSFVTIQANPFLFEIGENRQSTIRGQNSGRVYSSSHSHPLSPGQLLAPDLLLFEVEKAGVLERGRSWGTSVSPRSKWLFRGQESRRCRRELKIRAIGHEGEGLVEEEEAELRFYPRAPVVVVVVVPPQLGWNFADIPLPLFRPLFSSSLLSLSLLLFATHATLVGSLDPCPFEGRGFPLFPFSAATVTSTLSISPKADANEHMEVTWKYDVDVARRENGKGDDGLVKKAVTVTWI